MIGLFISSNSSPIRDYRHVCLRKHYSIVSPPVSSLGFDDCCATPPGRLRCSIGPTSVYIWVDGGFTTKPRWTHFLRLGRNHVHWHPPSLGSGSATLGSLSSDLVAPPFLGFGMTTRLWLPSRQCNRPKQQVPSMVMVTPSSNRCSGPEWPPLPRASAQHGCHWPWWPHLGLTGAHREDEGESREWHVGHHWQQLFQKPQSLSQMAFSFLVAHNP